MERSRAEIERLLVRYGAVRFVSGWDQERAVIGFEMRGRAIRMFLPIPKPEEKRFTQAQRGSWRAAPAETTRRRYEQECRRRWRALLLVIKAKLEAVASGIVTFEEEWLTHFVLPGGQTVGDRVVPELAEIYASGEPPRLLLGYEGAKQ